MIPIQAEICLKFRLFFLTENVWRLLQNIRLCRGLWGPAARITRFAADGTGTIIRPLCLRRKTAAPLPRPRPALAEGIHKLFTHPSKFVQSFPPGVWYPMSVDRITKAFFIISNLLSFSTQKNAPLEGGAFFHIFLSPSSLKRSLMRSLYLSMGGRPRHSHPMGMPGPSFFWWGAQPGGQVMSRPASTWKCRWWTD